MSPTNDGTSIPTRHGPIPLPAYLPDATRGAVRTAELASVRAVGIRALMVNTLHVMIRPGSEIIRRHGGLHGFMGWDGPLVTDSGGFQALSLIRENPKHGTLRPDGLLFRIPGSERKLKLTPEKSIQVQLRLGADVLVALDDCSHPAAPQVEQEQAVERTIRWAGQCRLEFDRQLKSRRLEEPHPLLVGVVQGGPNEALRRRCAEALLDIGFDAYGFGGWPVDENGQLEIESFALLERLLPSTVPRFALGVGKPEHLVAVTRLGSGYVFDCSLPTRDARRGRLLAFTVEPQDVGTANGGFYRYLYLFDREHKTSPEPVDPGCDCPLCRNHSRGYLHHLFRIGDSQAMALATLHNLRFYARLIDQLSGSRKGDRGR